MICQAFFLSFRRSDFSNFKNCVYLNLSANNVRGEGQTGFRRMHAVVRSARRAEREDGQWVARLRPDQNQLLPTT